MEFHRPFNISILLVWTLSSRSSCASTCVQPLLRFHPRVQSQLLGRLRSTHTASSRNSYIQSKARTLYFRLHIGFAGNSLWSLRFHCFRHPFLLSFRGWGGGGGVAEPQLTQNLNCLRTSTGAFRVFCCFVAILQ